MLCRNCQTQWPSSHGFCGDCGFPLTLPPSGVASPGAATVASEAVRKRALIALLLFLVLISAGAFFHVRAHFRPVAVIASTAMPAGSVVVRFSSEVATGDEPAGATRAQPGAEAWSTIAPVGTATTAGTGYRHPPRDVSVTQIQPSAPPSVQPYRPYVQSIRPYQPSVQVVQPYRGQPSTLIQPAQPLQPIRPLPQLPTSPGLSESRTSRSSNSPGSSVPDLAASPDAGPIRQGSRDHDAGSSALDRRTTGESVQRPDQADQETKDNKRQQLAQLSELEGKIAQLTALEQQVTSQIALNQQTASQQQQIARTSKGFAAGVAAAAALAAQLAEVKNRSTLRDIQSQLTNLREQASQLRNSIVY